MCVFDVFRRLELSAGLTLVCLKGSVFALKGVSVVVSAKSDPFFENARSRAMMILYFRWGEGDADLWGDVLLDYCYRPMDAHYSTTARKWCTSPTFLSFLFAGHYKLI